MSSWLKGLLAAVAGGALTGATTGLSQGKLDKSVGISAGAGALLTVLAYFKSPPNATSIPNDPKEGK